MARIWIGGAGGTMAHNVVRSLRESGRADTLIGASCSAADLLLAETDEKLLVPRSTDADYAEVLLARLAALRPDFLHVQHDLEVRAVSRLRTDIEELGVRLFLPAAATVERCVDKFASYRAFAAAGLRVPETMLVRTPDDLAEAFSRFGGRLWLRATVGGGGRGALPVDRLDFARVWIERFAGWGEFTAAAELSPNSVTWMSLWHQGELVVAQGRRRLGWKFAGRTLSGVTGITACAATCSDAAVDRIGEAAVRAVDSAPHGLFGVDLTYDANGVPNPTEINIGRFFTTILFFTRAGLNLPAIYLALGLDGVRPTLARRLNPLPDGLLWVRGMDREPVLSTVAELERLEAGR